MQGKEFLREKNTSIGAAGVTEKAEDAAELVHVTVIEIATKQYKTPQQRIIAEDQHRKCPDHWGKRTIGGPKSEIEQTPDAKQKKNLSDSPAPARGK